jgi:hypothetical protein
MEGRGSDRRSSRDGTARRDRGESSKDSNKDSSRHKKRRQSDTRSRSPDRPAREERDHAGSDDKHRKKRRRERSDKDDQSRDEGSSKSKSKSSSSSRRHDRRDEEGEDKDRHSSSNSKKKAKKKHSKHEKSSKHSRKHEAEVGGDEEGPEVPLPNGATRAEEEEDYFRLNRECCLWLLEAKGKRFADLGGKKEQKKYFGKFCKLWNANKLDPKYYDADKVEKMMKSRQRERTTFKWGISDADNAPVSTS